MFQNNQITWNFKTERIQGSLQLSIYIAFIILSASVPRKQGNW